MRYTSPYKAAQRVIILWKFGFQMSARLPTNGRPGGPGMRGRSSLLCVCRARKTVEVSSKRMPSATLVSAQRSVTSWQRVHHIVNSRVQAVSFTGCADHSMGRKEGSTEMRPFEVQKQR